MTNRERLLATILGGLALISALIGGLYFYSDRIHELDLAISSIEKELAILDKTLVQLPIYRELAKAQPNTRSDSPSAEERRDIFAMAEVVARQCRNRGIKLTATSISGKGKAAFLELHASGPVQSLVEIAEYCSRQIGYEVHSLQIGSDPRGTADATMRIDHAN